MNGTGLLPCIMDEALELFDNLAIQTKVILNDHNFVVVLLKTLLDMVVRANTKW